MNSRINTILFLVVMLSGSIFAQTFDPSQIQGGWSGSWFNNTYSTTGSASLDVSYDGTMSTLTMVLDLNGSVFGGSDPAPANLTGSYDQNGFSLTGNSSPYGDIFLTGDAAGNVSARLPNVDNAGIDSATITGTYSATNIDLTYLIYFTGGSNTADGVINFTKNNSTAVQSTKINPSDFRLFQNYPNPFNPTTNITFSLAKEAHVQINIYNLIGEKVLTLVNDNLNAGTHQVRFNSSSNNTRLASGVYFYSLETSNYKAIKKMILMK